MVPAARKGTVEVSDLPLPADQQAEACYEELNANWEAAVQEAKKAGKEPKLMKVRRRGGAGAVAAAARSSATTHSQALSCAALPCIGTPSHAPRACRGCHAALDGLSPSYFAASFQPIQRTV